MSARSPLPRGGHRIRVTRNSGCPDSQARRRRVGNAIHRPLLCGVAACLLASASPGGWAHDLITAESAERYLADTARRQALTDPRQPARQRAEAHVRLGATLDEIRELLNRDLAAHGAVQGLASQYLVGELARRGTPLAYSDARRRFLANTGHYQDALRIGPDEPTTEEAQLRLLRGDFYDSFDSDPLASRQRWPELLEQVALAETLDPGGLSADDREEVQFIAAILYTRAARMAGDASAARSFRSNALATIDAFEAQYPQSLRVSAMSVLRDALSGQGAGPAK